MITQSAMISIVGRPNVGKSTLLNALVGEKIAIVTPKPQTTRNRILAVLNQEETQFIFIDTPGYHTPRSRLGDFMVRTVRESVADVDAIVLVVEPIAHLGEAEKALIARIKQTGVPSVLIVNKLDTVKKTELLKVIECYHAEHDFTAIIPMSARRGDGLAELVDELKSFASESPALFPEDMITDQPERHILAEILREKMLRLLDKEVPHGIAVEIDRFFEREDGIIELDAIIYTEKSSHKGIIIGKQGAMLKRIGEMARADMERFMGAKIFLQSWVRVKENWRDRAFLLRNFGFRNE